MKTMLKTMLLSAVLMLPCYAIAAPESPDARPGVPESSPKARTGKPGDRRAARTERIRKFQKRLRSAFAERDKNGDGKLAMDEVKKKERRFERIDRDGDGGISMGEFRRLRIQRMAARRIGKRDSDGDRELSPGESKLGEKGFAKADTDGNGKLSRAELTRLIANNLKARPADRERPRKAGRPRE